jgi:hypothetical protein
MPFLTFVRALYSSQSGNARLACSLASNENEISHPFALPPPVQSSFAALSISASVSGRDELFASASLQ